MTTKEFQKSYSIDRTSRGVKAVERLAPPASEFKTADGAVFDPEWNYFYADFDRMEVQESRYLRQHGPNMQAMGLKVVAVNRLRAKRVDAVEDLQRELCHRIAKLKSKVQDLEDGKPQRDKTLKFILQCRG